MAKRADGTEKNRKRPLPDIARQLLVFSGNECAWGDPDCKERLVTAEDGWIGEMAHIIAAEPTGARHDAWDGKDVDDLRHFDNLILLCKNHARLIDSPGSRDEFTVEYLRAVKEAHERPYRFGLQQLEIEYRDVTKSQQVVHSASMRRFLDWENEQLSPDEEASTVATFRRLADGVSTLTDPARAVLALVAAHEDALDFRLVQRRLNMDHPTLVSVCEELERTEVATLVVDEWGQEPARIYLRGDLLDGVVEYWDELRRFAADEGIDLDDVFIGLDFSLLD